jgi:hypothetical protein
MLAWCRDGRNDEAREDGVDGRGVSAGVLAPVGACG